MFQLLRHFQLAVRALRRARGFAWTVVLTLALGIGLATAVFTVADTLLLRKPPGGALLVNRFLTTLLYDVSPTDATTLAGAAVLLTFLGALAAAGPARAGTRVDPTITMRTE